MNKFFHLTSALLLVFAIALCGCDKSNQDARPSQSPEKSFDYGQKAPMSAKQESNALIDQCQESYRYLYGEGGCLPNQMSPDRIEAACAGYSAWEQREDQCATKSFEVFFTCLREADCEIFNSEDEGAKEDGIGLGGLFSGCRRRFANDMNICLNAQKAEAEAN